jgi:hypothetical protein
MEQKSSERTKTKTKKICFSSNILKIEGVLLAEDTSGCMLVVPEVFGAYKYITLYQGRFHEFQL